MKRSMILLLVVLGLLATQARAETSFMTTHVSIGEEPQLSIVHYFEAKEKTVYIYVGCPLMRWILVGSLNTEGVAKLYNGADDPEFWKSFVEENELKVSIGAALFALPDGRRRTVALQVVSDDSHALIVCHGFFPALKETSWPLQLQLATLQGCDPTPLPWEPIPEPWNPEYAPWDEVLDPDPAPWDFFRNGVMVAPELTDVGSVGEATVDLLTGLASLQRLPGQETMSKSADEYFSNDRFHLQQIEAARGSDHTWR